MRTAIAWMGMLTVLGLGCSAGPPEGPGGTGGFAGSSGAGNTVGACGCVLHETYCARTTFPSGGASNAGTRVVDQCFTLPEACKENPTCACVVPSPRVNCTCSGSASSGIIVSCDPI